MYAVIISICDARLDRGVPVVPRRRRLAYSLAARIGGMPYQLSGTTGSSNIMPTWEPGTRCWMTLPALHVTRERHCQKISLTWSKTLQFKTVPAGDPSRLQLQSKWYQYTPPLPATPIVSPWIRREGIPWRMNPRNDPRPSWGNVPIATLSPWISVARASCRDKDRSARFISLSFRISLLKTSAVVDKWMAQKRNERKRALLSMMKQSAMSNLECLINDEMRSTTDSLLWLHSFCLIANSILVFVLRVYILSSKNYIRTNMFGDSFPHVGSQFRSWMSSWSTSCEIWRP